ncbi:hypothetical protein Kpho01_41050 [Kitasatospora phosalacinea]|uniref:Uncharacterized protein n=1 Tax=Kitasatospora phosalacinea TaxID=2065 RepID=A0A9W6PH95_9ACTN|nr:hypothetical protein Kpho01_41050 [Kitasatospora phosalacinea]
MPVAIFGVFPRAARKHGGDEQLDWGRVKLSTHKLMSGVAVAMAVSMLAVPAASAAPVTSTPPRPRRPAPAPPTWTPSAARPT